jgi:hypothetical protein
MFIRIKINTNLNFKQLIMYKFREKHGTKPNIDYLCIKHY